MSLHTEAVCMQHYGIKQKQQYALNIRHYLETYTLRYAQRIQINYTHT